MYNSLTYGTVIKELRTNRFLSQGELAEDICSQGMLSRIENNDVVPNVLVMQKLCERLNVSVNYVLTREETAKAPANNWLELLKQYKHSKKMTELTETIDEIETKDNSVFKTKLELQEYAYYKGCAISYLNPGSTEALTVLQDGLNYTYNRKKQHATDIEVMLLSEIGRVYYNQGKFELGVSFMKRSISQFYSDINKREKVDLIKVFYNISASFVDLKTYSEALEYIEQGVLWSQKKKSYYRLSDLYMLKGIVLKDLGRMDEAIEIVAISDTLDKLVDYTK